MNIIVSPYPSALKRIDQKDKIVVIIDVLRACTTIVQAFSQGCKAFYPVSSIKKAREKLKQFKRGEMLLSGERKGLKIKGFDLGNSPLEYTSDVVRNKNIIFTTSNCTNNLDACRQSKETLICSFLNIHSVVNYLSTFMRPTGTTNGELIMALSGREGDFSLEDAVCAGMLIDRLLARMRNSGSKIERSETFGLRNKKDSSCLSAFRTPHSTFVSDLGNICRITYLHYKGNIIDALVNSTHGKILKDLGFEEDIRFCTRTGKYEILPKYTDGVISCTH